MRLLALDPGLKTAWATFKLERRSLTLLRYGLWTYQPDTRGRVRGEADRERVQAYISEHLKAFERADEVCHDSELSGSSLPTNVPALGAFEACRVFAREHGRRAEGRRVFGQYARWVYWNDCAALANVFIPSGLKRWKAGVGERRAVLETLVGVPLLRTFGEGKHCLDAIACGICHLHRCHGWHPDGWEDPKVQQKIERNLAWLEAMRPPVTG